jgi:ParB family chromosome partitioning protein
VKAVAAPSAPARQGGIVRAVWLLATRAAVGCFTFNIAFKRSFEFHMQLNTLTNIEIPFSKLIASSDNVRVSRTDETLNQLATSIQAVGLLQSLVVQPAPRGKYAVVAGERRRAALSLLHEAGSIPASYKVPCRLLPKDADPTEASLSENVQRESMEPLEECSIFERLVEKGHAVPDIAARFGYSEALVERRLALARLSPVILDYYRQGQATLELLQAFTLTSDHAAQERAWNQLPDWNRKPDAIRRLLSQTDIPASDPQVRFVTLAAYEAAGGRTKRDLFADEDGNGVYLVDADILNQLVTEKLQHAAQKAQKDGWKWVEIQPHTDFQALSKFRRLHGEPAPLPKKQEAKRAQLATELETLAPQLDGHEEETEECQRLYDRIGELEGEIELIDSRRPVAFSEATKQTAGVVLSLDENGEIQLHQGLMRKEDEAALRAQVQAQQIPAGDADVSTATTEEGPGYSAALVQSLTTVKTAAIAAELAQQPRIALATVVYTLLLREFGFELRDYRFRSALQLSMTAANLREVEDSAAGRKLSELRQELLVQLPSADDDLWAWTLEQSESTLLRCLAYCAATAIDAIQVRGQEDHKLRLTHADRIARALNCDMARWFTPTAENFFGRVSKPQIAAALREAGKPAENETLALKKAQLAAAAETKIAGTGWLPEQLRIPANTETTE